MANTLSPAHVPIPVSGDFAVLTHGSFLPDTPDIGVWHPASLPGSNLKNVRDAGMEIRDPDEFDHARDYLKYEEMDFVYRFRLPPLPVNRRLFFECDALA